jgi:hypothetical protein
MDSALDNGEVYQELRDRLREELDYLREAAHQRLYALMLADQPRVVVPKPVEGYCTTRLLTMSWLEGRPLVKRLAEDPPVEERQAYAEGLFRAWYRPFYRYGVIHGDPHLGNYQVRPDRAGINLFDFGTIRVFPPSFVGGSDPVVRGSARQRRGEGGGSLPDLGLPQPVEGDDGSPEPLGRLPLRAAGAGQGPADPVLDDMSYGRKVAQKVHEGLKRTGGVKIRANSP